MTEPIIICPYCEKEVKLTESLAGPLVALAQKEAEQKFKLKFEQKEQTLKDIAREEAKASIAMDYDALKAEKNVAERQAKELNDLLSQRDAKLAEAQKAQADLMRKSRELDDQKREMELTIEKQVNAGLSSARQTAKQEAEEQLKYKVMEKEQTIEAMKKQLEDMQRKAEQGSQQLQGEVQEIELERLLATKFPYDTITPVGKGEFGGDVMQKVFDSTGNMCGTIL
jgi:hypothetical protein